MRIVGLRDSCTSRTGVLQGKPLQSFELVPPVPKPGKIFCIPELSAYSSASITLEPGDRIATNTPSSVGAFHKPPGFMKDGDLAEAEIEKLGTLRDRVRVWPQR